MKNLDNVIRSMDELFLAKEQEMNEQLVRDEERFFQSVKEKHTSKNAKELLNQIEDCLLFIDKEGKRKGEGRIQTNAKYAIGCTRTLKRNIR